ncbi:metalloendoproteinase 5-MMP-like [Salvia miltiorrhiza]|uniref:metalloendoproteinase 5-MMP-like n=1 Tax=Salvia miltiorrhiza TaxID=226208 RepID=UPI0025AD3040|nr:metalloendoproteinase 5-MMP-like [Salvia miltiorrhiza]
MALKLLNLLVLILIVSIGANSSPFDFIKNLEGCRKGNNTKDIYKLKTYLKRFGYLGHEHLSDDNDFNDNLELAVKTYQRNYNIKPTGIIDADTVARMTAPRCGVPDIINGVNHMQSGSYYAFVLNDKWMPSNRHLTYKFLGNFPDVAKLPAAVAFQRWASVTKFTFSEVNVTQKSDLTLEFFRGDHGDGYPFDGRGGVLAHSFYPTDGRFHFDLDELWFYLLKDKNSFDLLTISLHEIGHLLGLQHSTVETAVMFPTFQGGETKDLGQDDILGIRALYKL